MHLLGVIGEGVGGCIYWGNSKGRGQEDRVGADYWVGGKEGVDILLRLAMIKKCYSSSGDGINSICFHTIFHFPSLVSVSICGRNDQCYGSGWHQLAGMYHECCEG